MYKKRFCCMVMAGLLANPVLSCQAAQDVSSGENSSPPPKVIYLKDSAICCYDPVTDTRTKLQADASLKETIDLSSYWWNNTTITLGELLLNSVNTSPDQRYLCSYQNVDLEKADGFELILWDLNHLDNPPELIDQNVDNYKFLTEEKLIYSKANAIYSESPYFIYNMQDKTRTHIPLDPEINANLGYLLGPDSTGTKILWYQNPDLIFHSSGMPRSLYLVDLEKPEKKMELLLSDISDITYISDDYQTIYYKKKSEPTGGPGQTKSDDTLYCLKNLSNSYPIAGNDPDLDILTGTGNAYLSHTEAPVSVYDFMEDDMAEIDAAAKASWTEDKSADDLDTQTEKHPDWMMREEIRNDETISLTANRNRICYFDGNQVLPVVDQIVRYTTLNEDSDALLAIKISPPLHSIKISEITSEFDAFHRAREIYEDDMQVIFINEGKWYPLPASPGHYVNYWEKAALDTKRHLLYYVESPEDSMEDFYLYNTSNTLMAIPYTSEGLGTPEVIDQNVYFLAYWQTGYGIGEQVYYLKENPENPETFLLYQDRELIGECDGPIYNLLTYQDGFTYFFSKDQTLWRHSGSGTEKILENAARDFVPLKNGYVIVMDNSESSNLYLYKTGGSPLLIDTNVQKVSLQ